MKKKTKKSKPQKHYIQNSEVYVKKSEGKGDGLFAKVELQPNSRLFYLGKEINEETRNKYNEMTNKEGKEDYASYIMSSGRSGVFIDAHPRHKGSEDWIAGRINEPSPKTKANMILRYEKLTNGKKHPVLVTVKKIPADTELTFKYGSDFKRPYKVGQQALIPSWLRSS